MDVSRGELGAPVGMGDFETARVLVWVQGHGWVDRTERPDELPEAESGSESAA